MTVCQHSWLCRLHSNGQPNQRIPKGCSCVKHERHLRLNRQSSRIALIHIRIQKFVYLTRYIPIIAGGTNERRTLVVWGTTWPETSPFIGLIVMRRPRRIREPWIGQIWRYVYLRRRYLHECIRGDERTNLTLKNRRRCIHLGWWMRWNTIFVSHLPKWS